MVSDSPSSHGIVRHFQDVRVYYARIVKVPRPAPQELSGFGELAAHLTLQDKKLRPRSLVLLIFRPPYQYAVTNKAHEYVMGY
jgi:hypothetical protein